MRIVKFLLAIVIGVSIVGCNYGGGTKVTHEQISSIKKGVTTRAEVVAMLGQPDSTTVSDDGTETLTWAYAKATVVPFVGSFTGDNKMENSTLEVKLNKSKVVESYEMTQGAQKM